MMYGPWSHKSNITSFFYPGSTCSLILTRFMEDHKLEGIPVTITIDTVNGETTRETNLYILQLLTVSGERKLVKPFQMDKISETMSVLNCHGAKKMSSSYVQKQWKKINDRPTGSIERLVGAEVARYLPEKLEIVDNLTVKIQFANCIYNTFF